MRSKQTYSDESEDRRFSAELTVDNFIKHLGKKKTLQMINQCKGTLNYIYLLRAYKKYHPYEKN